MTARPSSTAPTAVWVRPRCVPLPWSRRPRVRSKTHGGQRPDGVAGQPGEHREPAGGGRRRVVEVGQQRRPRAHRREGEDAARAGCDVGDAGREPRDGEPERGTGRGVTDGEHVLTVVITRRRGPATARHRSGDPDRRAAMAARTCHHRPARRRSGPRSTPRRSRTASAASVAVSSPARTSASSRGIAARTAGSSRSRSISRSRTVAHIHWTCWSARFAASSPLDVERRPVPGHRRPHLVEPGAGLRAAREHRRPPRRSRTA